MGHTVLDAHRSQPYEAIPMKMSVIVNSKGDICVVHDEPFGHIPLWIKYRQASKKLDILFDNGGIETIGWSVSDQLDSYLVNRNRVKVVRIEEQKPVECWDTILLTELIH